jgi:peroxiredoxin Q/BCP
LLCPPRCLVFNHLQTLKKELPYSLISDPKRQLIATLGAGKGGKTARSHFIFEKGGKLVDKKMPVKPEAR